MSKINIVNEFIEYAKEKFGITVKRVTDGTTGECFEEIFGYSFVVWNCFNMDLVDGVVDEVASISSLIKLPLDILVYFSSFDRSSGSVATNKLREDTFLAYCYRVQDYLVGIVDDDIYYMITVLVDIIDKLEESREELSYKIEVDLGE